MSWTAQKAARTVLTFEGIYVNASKPIFWKFEFETWSFMWPFVMLFESLMPKIKKIYFFHFLFIIIFLIIQILTWNFVCGCAMLLRSLMQKMKKIYPRNSNRFKRVNQWHTFVFLRFWMVYKTYVKLFTIKIYKGEKWVNQIQMNIFCTKWNGNNEAKYIKLGINFRHI